MQSSTAAYSMHRLIGMVDVDKRWVTAGLYKLQNPIGVMAVPSKANFSLQCRAALLHTSFTGSLAWFMCIEVGFLQDCSTAKTHRCDGSAKQG